MSSVKEYLTLAALVISVGSQIVTWVSTGRDLVNKVEHLVTAYGEVAVKLDAIDHRAIDTANDVTALRTEMRALAAEVEKLRQDAAEKSKKRGTR